MVDDVDCPTCFADSGDRTEGVSGAREVSIPKLPLKDCSKLWIEERPKFDKEEDEDEGN